MTSSTNNQGALPSSHHRHRHPRITHATSDAGSSFGVSVETHSRTIQTPIGAGADAHRTSSESGRAPFFSYNNDLPFSDTNISPSTNTHICLAPARNVPPLLPRAETIALPALSPAGPIYIHYLVIYRLLSPLITWDIALPPSTASLIDGGRFLQRVAVRIIVSSIVIRVRGVARPIVIFPIAAGHPIRIIDILRGVYNAVRAEALEYGASAGIISAYRTSGRSQAGFEDATATEVSIIRAHLRNRSWWGGLLESEEEIDVWILHLL